MAEVQGRQASAEEERVARALSKYGHEYEFQFQVFTITGVKGSFTGSIRRETRRPSLDPELVCLAIVGEGKAGVDGAMSSAGRVRPPAGASGRFCLLVGAAPTAKRVAMASSFCFTSFSQETEGRLSKTDALRKASMDLRTPMP